MILAIPREIDPDDGRVAVIPPHVPSLTRAGLEVVVESEAGIGANYGDDAYQAQGARIAAGRKELLAAADIVAMIRGPGSHPSFPEADLDCLRPGTALVGFMDPLAVPEVVQELAARKLVVLAMELIPRTTRAQTMDALSSMATIAGYKAVLAAANALPKFFPMLMTAAGTITAARVLVVGAGVAGLQAIATARRLGAVVEGYDIRPEVKEQVESLGARFVELQVEAEAASGTGGYAAAQSEEFYQRQRQLMAEHVKAADVVITTAMVPGRRAPVLVTADMVAAMRPGSVVVDLAAAKGGNCEVTQGDQTVVYHGVKIIGLSRPAVEVAIHASQMYSKNVTSLLLYLLKDGNLMLDPDDEIVKGCLVARGGEIVHEGVRKALAAGG